MGDNKIAETKPPLEKESAIKGIPNSLEKKGNFHYFLFCNGQYKYEVMTNCILCQTWMAKYIWLT